MTALMVLSMLNADAQTVYKTKAGKITFYSDAPMEKIEAVNNQVDAKLSTNGQLIFIVAIKGFTFKNATMQEHFNENYLESTTYPKATFNGTVTNINTVDFKKAGTYKVNVSGTLELHGVKKQVTATGTITNDNGKIKAESVFKIKLADYNIKGTLIGDKIAKEVEITVTCKYD